MHTRRLPNLWSTPKLMPWFALPSPAHSQLTPALLLFLALLLLAAEIAHPQSPASAPAISVDLSEIAKNQNALRQELTERYAAIQQLRAEINQITAEQPGKLQALTAKAAADAVATARLEYNALEFQQDSARTGISTTQRQISVLEQAITALEAEEQLLKNPAKTDHAAAGDRQQQLEQTQRLLEQRRTTLALEQQNLNSLREWLSLLGQRRQLAEQRQAGLEALHLQQQVQGRQEAQQERAAQLEREQREQISKAEDLRTRLRRDSGQLSEAERLHLQTSVQAAEARAQLLRWDQRLTTIGDQLANWEGVAATQNADPQQLQEGVRYLTTLRGELREINSLIDSRLAAIEQRPPSPFTADNRASHPHLVQQTEQLFTELAQEFRQRLTLAREQSERLDRLRQQLETAREQRLQQSLLAREPFILFVPHQWPATAAELAKAPRILLNQIWLSLESLSKVIIATSFERWVGLASLFLLLAGSAWVSRRFLARFAQRLAAHQDDSFADQFILTTARLVRRNLWGITLAGTVALGLWLLAVPQPGLTILLTLVLFWVCIKTPLNLAWLVLAAPDLPVRQFNPRLYRLIAGIVLTGGILSALTILAHASALAPAVTGVLDQLLLLYWVVICHPVLRVRRMLLAALAERNPGQLWYGAIRLLSLVIPLALAVAGLLGLVGFSNLAWLIVWRALALMTTLLLWLLARGLIDQAIIFLKNYAIANSGYALIWTQEILEPLNRTLRTLLLVIAIVLLLDFYSQAGLLFAFWNSVAWQPVLMAIILALLSYEILLILGGWVVEHSESTVGGALIRHLRQPLRVLIPIMVAQLLLPSLELSPTATRNIQHALVLISIAAVGWLVVRLTSIAEEVVQQHYLTKIKDTLGARRIQTQFQMVRRITVVVVQILALATMMMTFPKIRELGAGLLASAGVAGLVIGVAARPFLENLIAGIQIGLTQPIRIDDVVVVEGEWGRIAEINATHVVVRLWDDRRLIVPLNYFNTKPFQNWTWADSELTGVAFFSVDYTFPVEAGRQELKRILDESELWDGRNWALYVTDTTERTITLRATMSAPDAPTAWNLRCLVRERFVAFLQSDYPQCLPHTRHDEIRGVNPGSVLG